MPEKCWNAICACEQLLDRLKNLAQVEESDLNQLVSKVFLAVQALGTVYDSVTALTAEIDRVRPAYERTWPVDPLVSAKMIDQAIVVRVPVLMSRFAGARKNAVHNRWYSHFFAESVYTVVRNLNVNPEMFADGKCLSFVSVYERNHNIPDADNLDSKAIVDAIVSSLPGGDSWATTTFFRMNTTSNGMLDEATYVAVTPALSPPPVPDLLEIVRKENQYEH